VIGISVPSVATKEVIFTSTVSVSTPVIIPFRYPLNTVVTPIPAEGTLVKVVVIPKPT
jgi:hypothetical protein